MPGAGLIDPGARGGQAVRTSRSNPFVGAVIGWRKALWRTLGSILGVADVEKLDFHAGVSLLFAGDP